jgi:hypothetical protein
MAASHRCEDLMSQKTATIVSLEEHRRRRAEAQVAAAAPATPAPVMWYPVWVMVPVWPVPEANLGTPMLVTG